MKNIILNLQDCTLGTILRLLGHEDDLRFGRAGWVVGLAVVVALVRCRVGLLEEQVFSSA